jgi:hypothetical protein
MFKLKYNSNYKYTLYQLELQVSVDIKIFEYFCNDKMKDLYLSLPMRYQQRCENKTRRRYAGANRETNARHQFPRRPVAH